ncbi:MAG: ATP-dependent helicase HrpB [Cytophagaceae bacterium]
MNFNINSTDLPVREIIPDLKSSLEKNNTLILSAPPGAGKSTIVPLALLNEPWLHEKKIYMLEPRRLAARTIAEYMASLLSEKKGETVGYRIRFEQAISDKTKIEVVTEGILSRLLQKDPYLSEAGLVIFDEFHERSIHADVAMALCRETQQILRPDLKILVMSATLNIPHLTKTLNAPVVESRGRQYPVSIKYSGKADDMLLPELTARAVMQAIKENTGDCLVFLPGKAEIKKCEGILKGQAKSFSIHPLYGELPPGRQYAAIMPDKNGKRKIVLATSIAETSLTIEGIKIVVDCGFSRVSKFDARTGMSKLITIKVSKDSADQRAGRAGRLTPGVCYRMWSEADHIELSEHRTPEILEADLASLVLEMSHRGIADIRGLTWLNPPPSAALNAASELLHQLGALENGKITHHGRQMHDLPCHPRIAHMLLMAKSGKALSLACDLAAVLEEKDPLGREAGVDINTRIDALRTFRMEKAENRKLDKIEKVSKSYRKLFEVSEDNSYVDPQLTGVLLAYAFPERIASARPGNNALFQLANGQLASFSHKDDLANEPWLSVAHLDAREGTGKIFLASPLNPKDLKPLLKEKEVIEWDPDTGELSAALNLCIGSIILKSTSLAAPDESKRSLAISDYIRKEGSKLLTFTEEIKDWQEKMLKARRKNPQEGIPDVSTPALLATNHEWLLPHLTTVKTKNDLNKLNLFKILTNSFRSFA